LVCLKHFIYTIHFLISKSWFQRIKQMVDGATIKTISFHFYFRESNIICTLYNISYFNKPYTKWENGRPFKHLICHFRLAYSLQFLQRARKKKMAQMIVFGIYAFLVFFLYFYITAIVHIYQACKHTAELKLKTRHWFEGCPYFLINIYKIDNIFFKSVLFGFYVLLRLNSTTTEF